MSAFEVQAISRLAPFQPRRADVEIDFARLVGKLGWRRLPVAVRQRFAHAPVTEAPVRYMGTMQRVECSRAGYLLAQLCRLIGTPFAPLAGSDIPVAITLRRANRGAGIVWDREYRYPGRRNFLVRSTKRASSDGTLLECVGGGFGMRLDVFERDRALHFRSRSYFWRCGPFDVPLPRLLSPGVAHVIHTELGGGYFRFEMTVCHRWLGKLFHQDGIFSAEGGKL